MQIIRHYRSLLLITLPFAYSTPVFADEITLAVANSTCSAITEVGKLFEKHSGVTLRYICKSSGRLAKGLKGKAITADVYISANRKWIDFMIDSGMVKSENVISPWGNELVVATRRNSNLKFNEWSDIASEKVKRILIGDPGTAPFGRYAKEAMQSTGVWENVKNKIQTKKHITLLAQTLADSEQGTVGILFTTNTTNEHKTLFPVNQSWHSPIRYYMAPVSEKVSNENVSSLVDYIQGNEAKKIFSKYGFNTDVN